MVGVIWDTSFVCTGLVYLNYRLFTMINIVYAKHNSVK